MPPIPAWRFKQGDRVWIYKASSFGQTGELVEKEPLTDRWSVRLVAQGKAEVIEVRESEFIPAPSDRSWLERGNRVVIFAIPRVHALHGSTGVLLRPARLLNLRKGWLLELDQPFGGLRRTRVAETELAPAPDVYNGGL